MSTINIIILIAAVILFIVAGILCKFYAKRYAETKAKQEELNLKLFNLEGEKHIVESMKREICSYEDTHQVEHFSKKVTFPKQSSLSLAKFVVGREIIKEVFTKHPEFLSENPDDMSWTADFDITYKKANE